MESSVRREHRESSASLELSARVAWIGSVEAELGWLYARINSVAEVRCFEAPQNNSEMAVALCDQLLESDLLGNCGSAVTHVVVAVQNRIDYSRELLEELLRAYPELSVAVGTGVWWQGAGRTGLGTASHPIFAWHRWWDEWYPWLAHDGDVVSHGSTLEQRLLLVGNCSATLESIRRLAESGGHKVRVASPAEACGRTHAEVFDWVLYDDSCLNTYDGDRELQQWRALLQSRPLGSSDGAMRLGCCVTLPRESLWRELSELGVHEFLGKPFDGSGLLRMLRGSASECESCR